jgi:alkanesulfonate monooxygenase SsuD/methylene tetrahydromethanopterin reductase-like flavin-dependent oxidoreductase (luciferase family)
VLFGVGGGWNLQEMRNHGTDPRRRWTLLTERLEAIRRIWTEEKAEFHGELVDFDPIYSWPKPMQQPHPPIHIGGGAPHALERAIQLGDGWMPIAGRGDDDFVKWAAVFGQRVAEAGRDPESMEMTVYGAPTDPSRLEPLAAAGVDRAVLTVPTARSDALRALDGFAALLTEVA